MDQKICIIDKQGVKMNAGAGGISDQRMPNMGFASQLPNEFSFKSLNKIK